MVDYSNNRFISIDCDDCEQFAEVLKKIWIGLTDSKKLASFNFVGKNESSKLPARPIGIQGNPLSNLGYSVISENPVDDGILVAKSDYRDPCFYLDGELILAASSDHILIMANIPEMLIDSLGVDDCILDEPGDMGKL